MFARIDVPSGKTSSRASWWMSVCSMRAKEPLIGLAQPRHAGNGQRPPFPPFADPMRPVVVTGRSDLDRSAFLGLARHGDGVTTHGLHRWRVGNWVALG